ncbi:replication protein [Domibacillus mangrovi]|uniref:Replication protein n=1 Tax=Domibacillus mangrovi TaxID=1714354 RepID=A0A1Q5NZI8_9BACI|nr:replication protein [Domibacillus mangrovi]OKL35333.1 replication protein [Domibacillus mangrovi]
MENLKWNETPSDRAKGHVLFHHEKADGWITLAKKEKSGEWQQYHYQADQLAVELSKWLGEDVYFSQNTFYKPQRRIENIRQLRALYVDVDCYVLNYDPEWVVGKTDLEIFKDALPDPNIILFSGRGIVYVWLIEPVPYQALPLWQAVQNYFCEQLKYVGADQKSIDATRVFRVAGSINSKSDNEVAVQYRHAYRYVLRDLQGDYLPELAPSKPKKPGRKSKIIHLHNVRSLHYVRLLDLVRLMDLRDGDVTGQRELLCFLYRYWSCCLTEDTADSLEQMLEFNSEFKEPLPEREVIRATKSAERAWIAKSDAKANEESIERGYPGAGYNLKNTTIIKWLEITPEEQVHLRTIIDGNEKRRRKRERDKLAFREKHGSVSREEYLVKQKDKTEDKLWLLKQAMKRHSKASNVKLAELLGVSEGYIRKLKKKL